jgi:multimeric flavodoxin WrbA
MRLLAVNGSPRKHMNTGSLLQKIVDGAESKGATATLAQLRELQYTGCVSCLKCKESKSKHYGRCAIKDALSPLLQMAHEADVLVLGSPFYYSMETSFMRGFMERLWFQYNQYSNSKPSIAPRKKATALVYTMNVRQEDMEKYGKSTVVWRSKSLMEAYFGSCEVFLCCDTKQVKDYSKYEFDLFDIPAKIKRHEEVFPKELEQAFELGLKLVS